MNGMYNGVKSHHMGQRPNSWQHQPQHQQQVNEVCNQSIVFDDKRKGMRILYRFFFFISVNTATSTHGS